MSDGQPLRVMGYVPLITGLHLGNLKSGRKESRVCFATEVAHSRQGAAFSLGNRRNTRWMGSGAARMQGVRVTPGLGTGC